MPLLCFCKTIHKHFVNVNSHSKLQVTFWENNPSRCLSYSIEKKDCTFTKFKSNIEIILKLSLPFQPLIVTWIIPINVKNTPHR